MKRQTRKISTILIFLLGLSLCFLSACGNTANTALNNQSNSSNGKVTMSISCAEVLDNFDLLDADKRDLIPEDGWVLKPTEVEFAAGESVFDLLLRVCNDKKIHMEYMNTPIYESAYIEGINNLYEFDCGPLSGWMYKVDDWFPNYGCSRYELKDGNVICWEYTCDLGKDIGGDYASGTQEDK